MTRSFIGSLLVVSGLCHAPAAAMPSDAVAPWPLTCGHQVFPRANLYAPGIAEAEDHPASEALRQGIAEQGLPRGGWRVLFRDETTAVYARPRKDGLYFTATLAREPAGWRLTGWDSGCEPYARLGRLVASPWAVAERDSPLTARTRRFVALASPQFCNGGRRVAAGRFAPPVVSYLSERIAVTFFVRPPSGVHTCEYHPPTRLRVRLSEPLGERNVVDPGFAPVRRVKATG